MIAMSRGTSFRAFHGGPRAFPEAEAGAFVAEVAPPVGVPLFLMALRLGVRPSVISPGEFESLPEVRIFESEPSFGYSSSSLDSSL